MLLVTNRPHRRGPWQPFKGCNMTDFHTEPGPILIPRKAAFAMLGVGTITDCP